MKENSFINYARPDLTIDLHNYKNVDEAIFFMNNKIYEAYQQKKEFVRIIHGIGSGVMKAKVYASLENNYFILEFAMDESGGSTMIKL